MQTGEAMLWVVAGLAAAGSVVAAGERQAPASEWELLYYQRISGEVEKPYLKPPSAATRHYQTRHLERPASRIRYHYGRQSNVSGSPVDPDVIPRVEVAEPDQSPLVNGHEYDQNYYGSGVLEPTPPYTRAYRYYPHINIHIGGFGRHGRYGLESTHPVYLWDH